MWHKLWARLVVTLPAMSSVGTLVLPHGHSQWSIVRGKLQKVADKTLQGLDAIGDVILVSPEWGLDKRPLLNVLNRALGQGSHYNKEEFGEDILPYIAKRALEVETLFPESKIQV